MARCVSTLVREPGSQFHETYATLGFRLALHDITDPPAGEPELTGLQFADLRLHFSETNRSLTMDEVTFAELFGLNPFGRFEKILSFRVRAYGERIHDDGCTTHDCFAHGADLAVGLTFATHDERFAIFAMADATVLFAPDFDGIGGSFVRAGVGPYGGVRARVGRAWSRSSPPTLCICPRNISAARSTCARTFEAASRKMSRSA